MTGIAPVGYGPVASYPATGNTPTPTPTPPAGFAQNGATNAQLAAMLSRVKGGTGRGRIVWKGDSTTVGQGGGSSNFALTAAAVARIPTRVSARLTSAGFPALDQGVTGDFGIRRATNGQDLIAPYDPRLTIDRTTNAWDIQDGDPIRAAFAGAAFWQPSDATSKLFQFKADKPVNRFEIIVYDSANETYNFFINGAAPTFGPSQGTTSGAGGFKRFVIGVATAGLHTVQISGTTRSGAFRGLLAWDSATPGIDSILHAALGTKAENLAASGGTWSNKEALEFDAPDLTIIMIGLNDMNASTPPANYSGFLGSMIDSGKLSGDVLLVFPFPAGAPYNNNVVAMRDAASAIAASKGVSFLSLYDYFGPFDSTQAAKMQDGVVHPTAAYYDEIADVMYRGIYAMSPSSFATPGTGGAIAAGATVAGNAVTVRLTGGTISAGAAVAGAAQTVRLSGGTITAGAAVAGAGRSVLLTGASTAAAAAVAGQAVTMRLTGASAAGQATVNGAGEQPTNSTGGTAGGGATVAGAAITVRLSGGTISAGATVQGAGQTTRSTGGAIAAGATVIGASAGGSLSGGTIGAGATVQGSGRTVLSTGASAAGAATVKGSGPSGALRPPLSRRVTLAGTGSRKVTLSRTGSRRVVI